MSKYKVGDRFRSKGVYNSCTAEIVHVLELCDADGNKVFTEYGILVTVVNDRQYYQGISSQSLKDLWSPVPTSFEEKKMYKVGDRFRSKAIPSQVSEIVHVLDLAEGCGTHDTHTVYGAITTGDDEHQTYKGVDAHHIETYWEPVPTFFEEKKTYKVKGDTWDTRFRIAEVVEYRTFGNGVRRVALALRQFNSSEVPKLLNEDDFDNMVEVED